ncbi:MAG: hypothetical protein IPH89_01330 [Bacteroidetes bacterium]|nr:hypothetical protein [Bacteroidota bacterium]
MKNQQFHTFHIPVMGLGFTIDTPLKVGKYGISSVISIIEDELIEKMREFHSKKEGLDFEPLPKSDVDHRAKRITSYLNLLDSILKKQILKLKEEPFIKGSDICRYFELLPENSQLKKQYQIMQELYGEKQLELQNKLRNFIQPGFIDVNIMTKCDKTNYASDGTQLPIEYNDALAALRGFANSNLNSSVVFSAGLNPRLYSYCEKFQDFFPDSAGNFKKRIILKVSDYRSAIIQGKILAKKGLWVSEFRIESGLNCGGHAFATEGLLLGPILQEFKDNREILLQELWSYCKIAYQEKEIPVKNFIPNISISAQGGIGTSEEDIFLQKHFNIQATGWGSPFLLVPDATNVDEDTLKRLTTAKQSDYFLSHSSPLGIPFNNFRSSTSEEQRKKRIEGKRPGSPCYKEYLAFNSEFEEKGLCTASRKFQNLKLKELEQKKLSQVQFEMEYNAIVEKDCLCEGLGASTLLKNHIEPSHKLTAVAICPGPNLAYFSNIFSLEEMVGHIYGRTSLLNSLKRPHVFINELKLYVDYLKTELNRGIDDMNDKKVKYYNSFKNNLLEGVNYYKNLAKNVSPDFQSTLEELKTDLKYFENEIKNIAMPVELSS